MDDRIDDVEEIEAIQEADPELTVPMAAEALEELKKELTVQIWTEHYDLSRLPVLLLDQNLVIIWGNQKYLALFGDNDKSTGLHLTRFFGNSFTDDQKRSLYSDVRSEESTYSWKGQVQKKAVDGLSVVCNLLLLPVFRHGEGDVSPVAYAVIIDDLSVEQRELLQGTYSSLLEASRLKDNDTGNHILRVNTYSKLLTENLVGNTVHGNIDIQFLTDISFLAAFHDVGKIGTSDNILNKEGSLEDWEWEVMKEHTINGAYLMNTYPNSMAKDIALFHHEKWNGSGYPYGIGEDLIPLSARIVAAADVYDALRMKRCYKDAFTHEKAVEIMAEGRGLHFDPDLFDCFLGMQDKFEETWKELGDKN